MLQTCKNHRIDLNFVRVFTHISSYPFNIKQQQINLASFPKRFDFIISLCSTFYTLIITFKANRKNLTQTQIWFLTVLYIQYITKIIIVLYIGFCKYASRHFFLTFSVTIEWSCFKNMLFIEEKHIIRDVSEKASFLGNFVTI